MARPDNESDIFRAIAHSARRQMIAFLSSNPDASAGQVYEACKLTYGTGSTHMKVLTQSGLVNVQSRGVSNHFRVDKQALKKLATEISNLGRAQSK
ncbi:MAG: ArsR/SmtB family transcription factor [Phycisphaerales bacterium]